MVSIISDSVTTAMAASCGGAATLGLIVLLIARELSSGSENRRLTLFKRHLLLGIAPLLLVFSAIVVIKVLEVLS